MPDRDSTLNYTDYDGDTLTITPIPDASSYHGDIPVVALAITTRDTDGPAVVYVQLADVDEVLAGIRDAADKARAGSSTDGAQQAEPRCTCGGTACASELCDCDDIPCPVDHAAEEQQAGGSR